MFSFVATMKDGRVMGRMKREMLDREDHGLRAARLVDLLNQGTGV